MQNKPLLSRLIEALTCLPGVGKKSAQRMAYHLLEKNRGGARHLGDLLNLAMAGIGNCQRCRDYTEQTVCALCANDRRDEQVICVVETPADLVAVESTAIFSGKYFVLMGNLSPLDGRGPEDLGIDLLVKRLAEGVCQEVIIATSATVEGEATAHYIKSVIAHLDPTIAVTKLAQGVPIGGELGYLDASTLSMSLSNRQKL